MGKNRLEAFSDGVLAIIITIMVLELRVPDATAWSEIWQRLPIFVSYLLSFIFVGATKIFCFGVSHSCAMLFIDDNVVTPLMGFGCFFILRFIF